MVKVSVIVPIYNVEKYLDRCMQSLLNQTLNDIEIIMVDDGSPDRCPQMCDEYVKKDSRVKVVHKKNEGLGYARNSGLEVAVGEYVAFVDSDDYVDTRMYERLYLSAKENSADVVFCGFHNEVKLGRWIESNEVSEDVVWTGDAIRNFMLDMIACAPYDKMERKYQMSVWHAIYKHSIIRDNNIRYFSERDIVSEDIPFQVDFLSLTDKVVYLKESFYYYCLNGSSLSKSFKLEKYAGFKKLRSLLIEKLDDEVSIQRINRLFIGYCRSYVGNLALSGRNDKKKILYKIVNDSIWEDIAETYKVDFLPMNSRICYFLILEKNITLLFMYSRMVSYIKNKLK